MRLRIRSRRAGFSLVEVVVVVAIIAIFAAIAIPSLQESLRRGSMNTIVRELQEDISGARAIATSNAATISDPNVRVRSAMLRLIDPQTYQIISTESVNGAGATILDIHEVTVLPSNLRIVNPTTFPSDITFRSNGTLVSGAASRIQVHDDYNNQRVTLDISVTGTIQIN